MLRTNLTAALVALSGFALSGATCQRVRIGDHELCGDKGELGATCFHLSSPEMRRLTREEWEAERFGQICMQADAYADIKKALLKLCDQTRRCTWEEVQDIKRLGTNVQSFKDEAGLL